MVVINLSLEFKAYRLFKNTILLSVPLCMDCTGAVLRSQSTSGALAQRGFLEYRKYW